MSVSIAELVAVLRADARQFTTAMSAAEAQTARLGGSTSKFGQISKAAFTVAGVAAVAFAAKSVQSFVEFERTMTRTMTLAGSTREEMKGLSAEILGLSGELGKSPQELAEALYFTESAGIAAADAMAVVESAAKASAVGLGETEVVADAVTSVLNAYGKENITAAHATDILVAAVREGKGEADAIAGAIGRVIPAASEMGVEFDEVAGSIAALTRTGLNANEAVTALRGIMLSLLDPSQKAEKILEQYGFSVDQVQRSIAQDGLLGTLQVLKERFGDNDRAMAQVFGNVRALTGALSLLGANGDEVEAVLKAVAEAGGDTEEAFAILEQTAGFKLEQAMADLQVVMVEVGAALVPVVVQIANMVRVLAPLLKFLPQLIAFFVAWKVALGIQALINGVTASTISLAAALNSAALAAGIYAGAFLLVGKAIGDTMALFRMASQAAEGWTADILSGESTLEEYKTAVDKVTSSHNGLRDQLFADGQTQKAYDETLAAVTETIKGQNKEILKGTDLYAEWGDVLNDTTSASLEQHAALADLVRELDAQGVALSAAERHNVEYFVATGDLEGAIRVLSDALGLGEDATLRLANAHAVAADEAKAQKEAEAELAGGMLGLITSLDNLREAQAEVNRLRENGREGTRKYDDAVIAALEAQESMNGQLRDYFQTLSTSGLTQEEAIDKVMRLGRQVGLTREDVLNILGPLRDYKGYLDGLPNEVSTDVVTNFYENYYKRGGHGRPLIHGGGPVRMHAGGLAADEVPKILQVGEFVMRRTAVQRIGETTLRAMNEGRAPVTAGATRQRRRDTRPLARRPDEVSLAIDGRELGRAQRRRFQMLSED